MHCKMTTLKAFLLSARIIKIFIFPSDPIFHAMRFCEKIFRFGLLRPTRAADHSIGMLRFVT